MGGPVKSAAKAQLQAAEAQNAQNSVATPEARLRDVTRVQHGAVRGAARGEIGGVREAAQQHGAKLVFFEKSVLWGLESDG